MNYRKNKLERLAKVAHLYYEEEKTQGEIAAMLQVSRPLVSRMLHEARELGIVEIRVHHPSSSTESLLEHLCRQYGLQGGKLFPEEDSDTAIDQSIAKYMLEYIEEKQPEYLGMGWGTIIGTATKMLERVPPQGNNMKAVCPLVGNSNVSFRQYHSDENVRMIAECYDAQPVFLHAPVFYADEKERSLLYATKHYREVYRNWEKLDMAMVGIHDTSVEEIVDYPMNRNVRTVGHMAAHSFDSNGNIVLPERDCIAHIPLEILSHCRCVVGLCASNVSTAAVLGALRTGLLTHIFLKESIAEAILEQS